MKITPIPTGIPTEIGTSIMVRVMPFNTTATTCELYWEVYSENMNILSNGNIQLTEEEFSSWGFDNDYLEDIALLRLGLEREVVIEEE